MPARAICRQGPWPATVRYKRAGVQWWLRVLGSKGCKPLSSEPYCVLGMLVTTSCPQRLGRDILLIKAAAALAYVWLR